MVDVGVHAEVPPLGLWGPGVPLDVTGHGVRRPCREPAVPRRGERGTAIVELVWLGLLLLVPLLYVVLAVFDTQRAAYAVSAAARSASRAFVTAPDQATAYARAEAAAGLASRTRASTPAATRSTSAAGRTRGLPHPRIGGPARVHASVDLPLMPTALGAGHPRSGSRPTTGRPTAPSARRAVRGTTTSAAR